MEFQFYWLLLLPLFFGFGWLAARMDLRQLLSESRALPAAYFKGLNFLLNEQPDEAIEAFSEVARSHQQTTELHFTLGSLFRRRGELDRATRMHQMLLDRSDLGTDQRLAAVHELAQDFLKAGLFDRAEDLFKELKGTEFDASAAQFLREIYVSEKEWGKAIEVAQQQSASNSSEALARETAHYLCELAALDYAQGRTAEADQHINEALQAHRRCVRARIMRGDWRFKEGVLKDAIQEWSQIEQHNADYLFLIAPSLFKAYQELDQADVGLQILQGWLKSYPSLDLLTHVYQVTLDYQGAEKALILARQEFHHSLSMPALGKYLEAQLLVLHASNRTALKGEASLSPYLDQSDLEWMGKLIQTQVQKQALFVCRHCGFKARQFYWHCPACGHWESYSPRRHIDHEESVSSPARM
jgi:lipopolysaccharide biosynthesis regulator YciM